MKLLVVTQALDLDDPLLSAYHGWVEAIAHQVECVEVICLKEGRHALPINTTVHSLGKEKGGRSRLAYALSFLTLVWRLRQSYDTVFVHMNEEYVLVAGPLWKLFGKRVYMWRNHYDGSWLTDIAAFWCANVFCTSKRSYTAKYTKTLFMPVGVNTERFSNVGNEARSTGSILFFSRIAPSKRVELFIDALALLKEKGIAFTARIVGTAPPEFEEYAAMLTERVAAESLSRHVMFAPGVLNPEAPALFHLSELYVNCSPSGMLDKIIFEAAASGCLVISESEDMSAFGFSDVTYESGSAVSLAEKIEYLLLADESEKQTLRARLLNLAQENSLKGLAQKLANHMNNPV